VEPIAHFLPARTAFRLCPDKTELIHGSAEPSRRTPTLPSVVAEQRWLALTAPPAGTASAHSAIALERRRLAAVSAAASTTPLAVVHRAVNPGLGESIAMTSSACSVGYGEDAPPGPDRR
jgi:hypothetical protein